MPSLPAAGSPALVRDGGTALTARPIANVDALAARAVTAGNFQLQPSTQLLERVADALAVGSIVPPLIERVSLTQALAVFAGENGFVRDGKTVIVL